MLTLINSITNLELGYSQKVDTENISITSVFLKHFMFPKTVHQNNSEKILIESNKFLLQQRSLKILRKPLKTNISTVMTFVAPARL